MAVPHTQRSWIGKAHMIGQDVTASYIYVQPEQDREQDNSNYVGPFDVSLAHEQHGGVAAPGPETNIVVPANSTTTADNEWVLLDATPASCANIGIHHLFPTKPPVDLVVSGPNFGRNSTALYIMSSGTVGASMEAALCGVRAIGLSYAYETREHDFAAIDAASRLSVRLLAHLYNNWGAGAGAGEVQLYSVNVPLAVPLTDRTRVMYTHILQNQWGPVFEPWEAYESRDSTNETHIGVPVPGQEGDETNGTARRDKRLTQFRWNPDYQAVRRSVKSSEPGNDGWAVDQGFVSVTPLRACFHCVPVEGDIDLSKG